MPKVSLMPSAEPKMKTWNLNTDVLCTGLKTADTYSQQLQRLLESFAITSIPRSQNTEADKLTNIALDSSVD